MEFLSTIEVRRVDNAGRGQQEQNGGNFVVEIDTETEEYCLVFKSTDAIMQLEVNDADYDVKMRRIFHSKRPIIRRLNDMELKARGIKEVSLICG